MEWVDLLMQIDFLHEETTEWDSNDPLPWTIVTPDRFDVVGGRGQGIQRLPGNKTYRELVSMNKVRRYSLHLNCRFLLCELIQLLAFLPLLHQPIYARCHKSDKGKVAKVRQ